MSYKSFACCVATFVALNIALHHVASAASFYTQRLDDPRAIYLMKEEFGAHADGVGDDTEALQKAIDAVVKTTIRGIVFVPEGTYRLSNTIRIWPGIRVIGYGRTRPIFVLRDSAAGFQGAPAYVFHFAGNIPGHTGNAGFVFQPGDEPTSASARQPIEFTAPALEANPGTF